MATEPLEHAKTPVEIYTLASRSEQVAESARLLEYALREYSGDYTSGFSQLYNSNRKTLDKKTRDEVRPAFDTRNKLKNVAKYGQPDFQEMTAATESFIAAANFLFSAYPKIYLPRFVEQDSPPVQDSGFFERGFEAPNGTSAFSESRSNRRITEQNQDSEPTSGNAILLAESVDDGFIPPTYSLPDPSSFFEPKLSIKQLEKMCHRLGRSLKAGVPIVRAWKTESENVSGKFRESYDTVATDIAQGERLSAAVAKQRCFPPVFCEMLQVGDETGRMDQVLLQLADHYRNLIQMRRTFAQGITWPVMQLCGAIGVISLFFIALAILDSSMAMFKAPDIFMLGFGPIGNLFLFWTLLIVFGGGLFIAVRGIVKGWFGELPIKIALKIPLLGNTIKTMCLSRFAWSFGMAVDTGMDATRAIRLGIRSTNLHFYKTHEDEVAADVGAGKEFAVAMERTDAFPDDLLESVRVGELTGELTESLERLSDDYKEQAETSLKRISQICGFVVMLFGMAVVALLIFLMYAQYFGMINDAIENPMGSRERNKNGEVQPSSNLITAKKNEMVDKIRESKEMKDYETYTNVLTDGFNKHGHDALDALDPLFKRFNVEDNNARSRNDAKQ